MENKFFPVAISLKGKKVLLIGGGKIALRKAKTLLQYECRIDLISKKIQEEEFLHWMEEKKIHFLGHQLNSENFQNYFLVVAATSDEKYNQEIATYCMKKNILVNNISSKEDMNLRFVSIYEFADYQIAVSANGNPKKAIELRDKIKHFLETQQ